jgi:hypothetical protein
LCRPFLGIFTALVDVDQGGDSRVLLVVVVVAVVVAALADHCFPSFVLRPTLLATIVVDPGWEMLVIESSLDSLRIFFPGRAPADAEG